MDYGGKSNLMQSVGIGIRIRCLNIETMFRDPGTLFQNSGRMFQDPGTLFKDHGTMFQDPGTMFQDPGTMFQDPGAILGRAATKLKKSPGPQNSHD